MRTDSTYFVFCAVVAAVLLSTGPVAGMLTTTDSHGEDDGPPHATEEPILAPDSEFERTEWGFKETAFEFPEPGADKPVVLEKEGYGGAGDPQAYVEMRDGTLIAVSFEEAGPGGEFIEMEASIRGTECSGGQFNLYDRVHAWDSHELIEWVADQPWSNGRVGMMGWSFSGQTAFWAASTQPPSLEAVAPSLLHADIYRDIFMPGGVENYAFPVIWYLEGPNRVPEDSIEDGRIPNDEICTQNQADETDAGEPPVLFRKAIWAAVEETDNDWYAQHAAANWADEIEVPYLQQTNWHDEQTGPRAAVLWNYVDPGPATYENCRGEEVTVDSAKWARTGNGDHGHGDYVEDIVWDFFDVWLNDAPDEDCHLDDQVVNYFEAEDDAIDDQTYTTKKSGDEWPFEDTDWTRYYAHDDGTLDRQTPGAKEGTRTYLSGTPVQNNWFFETGDAEDAIGEIPGSDQLVPEPLREAADDADSREALSEVREHDTPTRLGYVTEAFDEPFTIAGPILWDMNASLAGVDTDFFVTVSDVHPDGQVEYVQRGLLKASHNAVYEERSWYNDDGVMIQPYRPHTNPHERMPGETVHYPIEVWPTGHIFRPGHQLMVEVHTPPALDGLWGYTATEHDPTAVTVHHDADRPTSLLLPQVTPDEPGAIGEDPDGCGVPAGFPCAPSSTFPALE